jgi:hypothetical protein
MHHKFSKSTLFIFIFIGFQYLTAQVSDWKLSELLSKQDYWELNKQYPSLKKQASEQYQLFIEAYLNYFSISPNSLLKTFGNGLLFILIGFLKTIKLL